MAVGGIYFLLFLFGKQENAFQIEYSQILENKIE